MFLSNVLLWISLTLHLNSVNIDYYSSDGIDPRSLVLSFEIQIPERVSFNGEFISYDLRHELGNRRTRSTENHFQNIYYSLPLSSFGKLLISLSPNKRLLAPALVVEKWPFNSLNPQKISSDSMDFIHKFCYFEGFVLNLNKSLVSLSTCDGLRGLIRINGQDFMIEPIYNKTNNFEPNYHKITKRSVKTLNKISINDEIFCGTSENTKSGVNSRKLWEKKRKKSLKSLTKRKRSVSVERNVETLIVADPLMVNYYNNEDLQMYILTVMNVVSALYHDYSIGNAINIVIVRVILLQNQTESNEFSNTSRPNITLNNFCRWQQQVNPSEESHPNHHDVAVLITRDSICRTKSDRICNSLGLAEVAGMCQPLRSCALTEDTGLSLAFTIAHEIGHNFGMSHDGSHNGCVIGMGEKHHIMAPSINPDTSPVWSHCSRTEITNFLDRDWGYCLDDKPTEHQFNYPELPPGAMYNADHQCRLQYGPEAQYCEDMKDINICETLWCRTRGQCISKLKPGAEGTICGNNKWCVSNNCVEIGERPAAINGEWGQWSPWTECSRSCGAGVMHSERECNNPLPLNGGRYCIGERKRYKVCNIEPCDSNNKTFRGIQCSSYDTIEFNGQHHKWQPVLTSVTPCQLHCKPEGKEFSVMLSDRVIDGTPCHPGTKDMCINGKCRSVSCDWSFDSDSQEDRCGICHGDGTQCLTIKGNFTKPKGFGYTEVLSLSEGVSNFRMEEMFADSNYLSITDNKGEYILNGDYIIDFTAEYSLYGTTIYYDRDSEGREKLHIPGPLPENLKIMILFQGENRGLKWEYTVADLNHSRKPEFEWLYEEYGICSQTCGKGIQLSKVRCYEKEAGLVEDNHCSRLTPKPQEMKRVCNDHECPARWWSGPWQLCNATCGGQGFRKRSVICVRSLNSEEELALRNKECDPSVRPIEIESCIRLKPCTL